MLEAFVIPLREGLEAALIVGLLLGVLTRAGRPALRGAVWAGLAAAVALSVAVGVALVALGVSPENEAVEGFLLLISAVLVAGLVLWMHRHGQHLKAEIETRAGGILEGPGARTGLFLFTLLMIGREGAETVFFLLAAGLTTEGLGSAAAAVAGLGVAIGLAIALFRGSLRLDLARFFRITTIILLLFTVQLLAAGVHELMEAGVVPSSRRIMAVVGPLVRHSVVFVLAVLLLPALALMARGLRPIAAPAGNPAEVRRQRAQAARDRWARLSFGALGVVAVSALGWSWAAGLRDVELSPPTMLAAADGVVTVPLAGLGETTLYRYGADLDGRIVRFLVWRAAGEPPRTAFDACAVCGAAGYYQKGAHVVCRNCVAEIHAPTIGQSGGCNPLPLPHTLTGDALTVRLDDLRTQAVLFASTDPAGLLTCPRCGMRFEARDAGPERPDRRSHGHGLPHAGLRPLTCSCGW